MKYYRVKPEYDNSPKYVRCNGKVVKNGILVGNELLTPGERNKIVNNDQFFEEISIPRYETYWFFGARFEYGKGPTTYAG